MAELLSMGELLIDFTPTGATEDGRLLFARNPGGAPANVAVQAVRAGVTAGFLGRVGKDMFGDFLVSTLRNCGVETAGLSQDQEYATTLAFVQLNERGDRDFSFYRDPGADTRLSFEETDLSLIENCKLLCFGSLLLTAEPSRSAVEKLVEYGKSKGKLTAYDPNWRPPLWKDQAEGVKRMQSLIGKADIMKVSEEELALLTGEKGLEAGAEVLLRQGVSLVTVTLGPEGCAAFTKEFSLRKHTYDTKVCDTTGSGDSFFGALLAKLVQAGKHPARLTEAELSEFIDFANAAGAMCAAKAGAIPALPDTEAIEACRKAFPLLGNR
ncbi:carbohydrate kinase family protein [Neglectibacter caecimuris]|uniref:carbohydrate kinase family protein n=1 Tax=Neglectibacter caecimuris TaxID=3093658 RepID=UPI002AC8FACA|nr:carbohydrate kinase [Neglectibacter sp. M00184]